MLIYFAGSIRAGRSDAQLYYKLVEVLKKYGTVLTEHVGNLNLTSAGKHTQTIICTFRLLLIPMA